MYLHYPISVAAKHIGVSTQTLRNWEKRKLAGHPRFANYPDVPRREAGSNYRMYDEPYMRAVLYWHNPNYQPFPDEVTQADPEPNNNRQHFSDHTLSPAKVEHE